MIPWALVLALANAGSSRPVRMAMMAITTSSSMSVKPLARRKPELVCIVVSRLQSRNCFSDSIRPTCTDYKRKNLGLQAQGASQFLAQRRSLFHPDLSLSSLLELVASTLRSCRASAAGVARAATEDGLRRVAPRPAALGLA